MNNLLDVSQTNIESKIYTIRGHKVMLDFDLAEMYGVENKRLKEQVRPTQNDFRKTSCLNSLKMSSIV